jgi:hypothetical protein
VAAIASTPRDDGLVFDADAVHGEAIRDGSTYPGVRVHVTGHLAKAVLAVHVDINFGDPIWPAPIMVDLPCILGGTIRLPGYPAHMVLAEKIVTALERGTANTRWRDFVDIALIIARHRIAGADMEKAIRTVASYRRLQPRPLAVVLTNMGQTGQQQWTAWRRKQRLEDVTPTQLCDLLQRCCDFADPAIEHTVAGLIWDPAEGHWRAPDASRPAVLDPMNL